MLPLGAAPEAAVQLGLGLPHLKAGESFRLTQLLDGPCWVPEPLSHIPETQQLASLGVRDGGREQEPSKATVLYDLISEGQAITPASYRPRRPTRVPCGRARTGV